MPRFRLDDREFATVLAALRQWQSTANRDEDEELQEIATNCGRLKPLDEDEIDELCERINTQPYASGDQLARARELYVRGSDDNIAVDPLEVEVSATDHGVWVQAWLWLPNGP